MSNRRIVEQLILRLKCAPSIAPMRAKLALDLTDWVRLTLRASVGNAPTQWGHRYDLTVAEQALVCDTAAAQALGDAQQCLFYQHRSVPSDERLLESALSPAINSFAWPSGEFGDDWRAILPFWQLTPRRILHGLPSWMIGLFYLIALSRHEWVFVALYGGRTDAPDWRETLGRAWFNTSAMALTPDVKRAVEELESIALDLQYAYHQAVRPSGSASATETFPFLSSLEASFPTPLSSAAFVACVCSWLKAKAEEFPSTSLGEALRDLNQQLNQGANSPAPAEIEATLLALRDLSRVNPSSYTPALDLYKWLKQMPTSWDSSLIVGLIFTLPAFLANADSILSPEGLRRCLIKQCGSQPQYAGVIDGLFRGGTIPNLTHALARRLVSHPIPTAWVREAIKRGGEWLAAPPFRSASPKGWDFTPEVAAGLTAADVNSAIDWLDTRSAVPPSVPAVWFAVCNLVLSCCLEEIVCAMQGCYRHARQRGIGT